MLSGTASVGFVAIMGRPMATSQDFVNWVCGPGLEPLFLMYLLRASRVAIRGLSSGAIHKTVYVRTVKAFQVCIPDVAEQKGIADEVRKRLDDPGRGPDACRKRSGGNRPPSGGHSPVRVLTLFRLTQGGLSAQGMTWNQAIKKVLSAVDAPTHYADIADRIVADGLRKSVGAMPALTVVSQITVSMKHQADESPYVRVAKGV